MATKTLFEEFDLRILSIKIHIPATSFTVFEAAVLAWKTRRKEWVDTRQRITCVGNFYSPVENDHLHVLAEEIEDPRYGLQYQIYQSERVEPGTEVELRKFLTSIKGIGPKNADILIEHFGLDVFSQVLKDCSALNRITLSHTVKEALYSAIVENQVFEQLLVFLQLHKLSPCYATQIYEKYGANAIYKICDNPYSLYIDDVIDFEAADRLNSSLGGCNRKFRVYSGVLACMRHDSESRGNLFIAKDQLPSLLFHYLQKSQPELMTEYELTEAEVFEAVNDLSADGYLWIDHSMGDDPAVYLKSNYFAEKQTATRLYDITTSIKRFHASPAMVDAALAKTQADTKFNLADEQKAAIKTALTSPISILTGGPGTGKTQTLTMLILTAKQINPKVDIRLCAPTGKAAVRMHELTNLPASTIHRMVGYPHKIPEPDSLLCDLLIVDEFSMCDVQLCSLLFRCINSGARIVIVGDHEQLPSVGPGLVLRDLIDSEMVPVTKLTKVFRQAGKSRIVSNAHTIINTPPTKELALDYSAAKGEDFYFIEAKSQKKIQNKLLASVERLLNEGYTLDQIEILSPIHGGLLGTDNINYQLQEMFKAGVSGYQTKKGIELKVGDKVIQTKNNYDLMVFNGETGTVKTIAYAPSKAVEISYPDRDVWYNSEEVDELDLAYAITTHRSQGSEFAVVIIPIHEALLFNSNRELLYTAITRAKKRVILIGDMDIFYQALKKTGTAERKSNLMLRLQAEFLAPDQAA